MGGKVGSQPCGAELSLGPGASGVGTEELKNLRGGDACEAAKSKQLAGLTGGLWLSVIQYPPPGGKKSTLYGQADLGTSYLKSV